MLSQRRLVRETRPLRASRRADWLWEAVASEQERCRTTWDQIIAQRVLQRISFLLTLETLVTSKEQTKPTTCGSRDSICRRPASLCATVGKSNPHNPLPRGRSNQTETLDRRERCEPGIRSYQEGIRCSLQEINVDAAQVNNGKVRLDAIMNHGLFRKRAVLDDCLSQVLAISHPLI